MKTYIILAAIAIVAVAATGGGYYRYLQTSKAAFTVMYDITDPKALVIDTSEVPKHITASSSKWGETSVRFLTISDFRLATTSTVTVPATFPLTSNPYSRNKDLKAANQAILKQLDSLVAQDTGRNQSVIYEPMANELTRLAQSDAHTRELIVYSDLQENTPAFSTYRKADSLSLQLHRDAVMAFFEKEVPLPSLKGITVYFIYNAKTPHGQDRFLTMAHLFGDMFVTHGADVVIGTNLTN